MKAKQRVRELTCAKPPTASKKQAFAVVTFQTLGTLAYIMN